MDIDLTKMEVELKLATFTDHVDSTFVLDADGTPVDLVLMEAKQIKPTPKGPGVPDTVREDPFALLFRGPGDRQLVQRIFRMTHETLGELFLFLVPISKEEEGFIYESVCN